MGQSMRDIKRSIKAKEDIRKTTKALKLVSAAKLRRAQEQAQAARPYAEKLRDVIINIAQNTANANHPMLVSRPIKKTGYLIITSDRGQAGGYNSNLLRMLVSALNKRHQSKDEYVIFVIGRKGRDFLRKRNYPVINEVTGLPDSPTFADVKEIAEQAVRFYAEEKFDELYLLYNEFVNPVVQRPTEKRLLPLAGDDLAGSSQTGKTIYEYEPSQEEVLSTLLPSYAEALIYSALLDGKASEHAARMNAMSNATDNATEMIESLKLQFNRARQAAITQEIAEIVGGAAALE
ncbi:ATP synthase F1 subunit gamma [Laceyella sacchari]|jgi:F-type H+-transporting ATPase subunit gamma|uniref:ATP synthase gamma chain n=1 Tax=Laceyella sacchari TaxID=37482 RepID=A0ABY5U688_LACSH|nr:ATP synthase F1 subunit gamma [Laceyella sacchari]TCW39255.1 F-type H+-transporting ATPase subunit gamma [Laceyella sacchari]UWE03558.1 ATP synthase F1 subunit gamma [Laceyella sacchari]